MIKVWADVAWDGYCKFFELHQRVCPFFRLCTTMYHSVPNHPHLEIRVSYTGSGVREGRHQANGYTMKLYQICVHQSNRLFAIWTFLLSKSKN